MLGANHDIVPCLDCFSFWEAYGIPLNYLFNDGLRDAGGAGAGDGGEASALRCSGIVHSPAEWRTHLTREMPISENYIWATTQLTTNTVTLSYSAANHPKPAYPRPAPSQKTL